MTGNSKAEFEAFVKSKEDSKKRGREMFARIGYYIEIADNDKMDEYMNKWVENVLYEMNLKSATIY